MKGARRYTYIVKRYVSQGCEGFWVEVTERKVSREEWQTVLKFEVHTLQTYWSPLVNVSEVMCYTFQRMVAIHCQI
jgi:hypothetical protein